MQVDALRQWSGHLLWHHRPEARLRAFAFRSLLPLFDTADFSVAGSPSGDSEAALRVLGPDGQVAMTATAEFGEVGG